MGNLPLIKGNFKNKSIISIDQLDKNSLLKVFKLTPKMRELVNSNSISNELRGKIISLLFFEPSSRTFSSFAASIKRLGGQTIELQNMDSTSVKKGEDLEDTLRTFSTYSNGIIIRHPEPFSAQHAASYCEIPVINAGDGKNEHPTQAILDLFTIYDKFKTLDNLTGVFAGDLLNGRTVHSLIRAFGNFSGAKLFLLSPRKLKMPRELIDEALSKNLKIFEIHKTSDIPLNANFWYWTRVQKERFKNIKEYEKLKNSFILSRKLLAKKGNDKLILMHPLPRLEEIEKEVDEDSRALYFRNQIKNGLYVRMALLSLIFK